MIDEEQDLQVLREAGLTIEEPEPLICSREQLQDLRSTLDEAGFRNLRQAKAAGITSIRALEAERARVARMVRALRPRRSAAEPRRRTSTCSRPRGRRERRSHARSTRAGPDDDPPEPPRLGASEEIVGEHARRHGCGPNAPMLEVVCPCGTTVLLVCARCGEPVFAAVAPGTFCVHAQEAIGEAP